MADDDPGTRIDDDECTADGLFSTRFSATRLRQVADSQSKHKKEVISKGSFGSLLNISAFSVPSDLLDWVVMKIDPEQALFSHKKKSIVFTKDMVRKKFNVPSGSRPVELLRRNEPHVLREPYRVGSRAPMKHTIQVLKGADDEDAVTIDRTWALLCIALVLSPGTGNMVPLEYVASLIDMDKINEFAWDEHFLGAALKEVKKYQQKREAGKSGFWIGGCLPMFAIVYMDFVDLPRALGYEHRINYALPRACFICNNDFKMLEDFAKNKLCLDKIEFGKRNFRRLPETPYVSLDGCNEADCENNNVEGASADANIPEIPSNPATDGSEIGGDVCGSLDEWLQPLPSSQDLEIPHHMLPIYEKHKKLYAAEVKNVLSSFGQIMQSIFCKRVASILVEANSMAATTKEKISEDVTFQTSAVNAGNATGANDTRAPPHTSPKPDMSAAAQEAEVGREVEAGPNTSQNGAHRDIGLDKEESCGKLGKEDVQMGQDKGGCEEVVITEHVAGDSNVSGVADEGVILSQGTVAALAGLALEFDDGPSCSLFEKGTEDYEWLNSDDDTTRKVIETAKQNAASPDVQQPVSVGPTFDKTPQLAMQINNSKQHEALVVHFDTDLKLQKSSDIHQPVYDASPIAFTSALLSSVQQGPSEAEFHEPVEKTAEASSGRVGPVKKAVKKRTAQPPDVVPKMKKTRIDRKDDGISCFQCQEKEFGSSPSLWRQSLLPETC